MEKDIIEKDDIPIKFQNSKLQKSFEYYWKAMKCINNDFNPKLIESFFVCALEAAESHGYIKL